VKLGIGTARFGMDYGELSSEGRPKPREISRILKYAAGCGIRAIDTAPAYGEAERLVGASFPEDHHFKVITKTLPVPQGTITKAHIANIRSAFLRSLKHLRLPKVYGLLVHRPENLVDRGGEMLSELMEEFKASGLAVKIGISAYTAEQIERAFEVFPLDLVQVPLNILDQRLITGGTLTRLSRAGVEVHARSIFLQGALLLSPDCLPPRFTPIRTKLNRLHAYIRELGMSPLQMALSFAMGMDEVANVICGIATVRQLEELCETRCVELDPSRLAEFVVDDVNIIDPSRW